eukprot:10870964-Lingulodinium_polyedra.AAC.1
MTIERPSNQRRKPNEPHGQQPTEPTENKPGYASSSLYRTRGPGTTSTMGCSWLTDANVRFNNNNLPYQIQLHDRG